jgi:hypothetical protein
MRHDLERNLLELPYMRFMMDMRVGSAVLGLKALGCAAQHNRIPEQVKNTAMCCGEEGR